MQSRHRMKRWHTGNKEDQYASDTTLTLGTQAEYAVQDIVKISGTSDCVETDDQKMALLD